MDREQARSAARAIMGPGLREQEVRADRARDVKATSRVHRRRGRIALVFMIAGAVAGLAMASWTGVQFGHGAWCGLLIGGLVGWAVAYAKVRTGKSPSD